MGVDRIKIPFCNVVQIVNAIAALSGSDRLSLVPLFLKQLENISAIGLSFLLMYIIPSDFPDNE